MVVVIMLTHLQRETRIWGQITWNSYGNGVWGSTLKGIQPGNVWSDTKKMTKGPADYSFGHIKQYMKQSYQ